MDYKERDRIRYVRRLRRRRARVKEVTRFAMVLGGAAAVGLAVLFLLIALFNKYAISIDIIGGDTVMVEYGNSYEEEGATAKYYGTVLPFHNKKIKEKDIAVAGYVDTQTLGEYFVSYTVTHRGLTRTKYKKVVVQDTTPPEISLVSNEDNYTSPGRAYVEEGFSAIDVHDGDVTANVTSEERDGKVIYTVTDEAGNTATAERTIVYDDRNPPLIELTGGASMTVAKDSAYVDKYTAIDDCDGDISDRVQVSGSVDTSQLGTYTLTYTATDDHGNTGTAERTVKVVTPDQITDKVIYLTFDDGPGPYTQRLLSILDEYNVKVTFFVTNQFGNSDYLNIISDEAAAGHTVAIHSYTHDYPTIYSSTAGYWADFDRMNDVIEEKTGSRTNLFRFPGGGSNTVSANYTEGIMTELASQAGAKGYVYFDWNVESGDAGATTSSETVYENIIAGCARESQSVVLCHDIKEYTVDAIENVIKWGLENGYTFLPMTEGSPTVHQGINN